MRHERCPSFNWKEDALESWIILILEVTFPFESDVKFSFYRHEYSTHVGKLCVIKLKILKSVKLVLVFLIFKLNEIIRMRNDKKFNFHVFIDYIDSKVLLL